jgi:putative transposase
MQPQPFSHSFGESNFHIVFKPKYSHDVLRGRIAHVCDYAFEQASMTWRFCIVTKRINPEHVHHFVSLRPDQSPAYAVHKLKGFSAHKLFETFPWLKEKDLHDRKRFWGGQFWSDGYFFRSIGSTTDRAIQFYIDVANDPLLREQYYTYSRKKWTRKPAMKDDPYIAFLEGKLRLNQIGQKRLNSFAAAS